MSGGKRASVVEFSLTFQYARPGRGRTKLLKRDGQGRAIWTRTVRVVPEINDPTAWKIQLTKRIRAERGAHHVYGSVKVLKSDGSFGYRPWLRMTVLS